MNTQTRAEPSPGTKRLESWKEIAAYLNRSERTVRRWEDKEGLPVHRLQHEKRGASAAPLRVLAAIDHYHHWDHASAERLFRQSIDLDASGVALSWFSEFLMDLRRFDEAVRVIKRAQDIVPRWLEPMTVAGNIHLFTGHPELAIAQLRKSHELMGQVPFTMGDLGYALAVTGARDEAERMLADLQQRRGREFYPAYPIAAIHLGLGRNDAALEWLERAVDEQHLSYYLPSVEPMFDPIRSHPRFRALLKRINLER